MPKLAANLTMMFCEHPFEERFAAARACGFKGVECHFPYHYNSGKIRDLLQSNGLQQVLFNLPPGDWEAGERGISALPGRESEFIDGLGAALEYANAIGCRRLHAMAGIIENEADHALMENVYIENLKVAALQCSEAGIQLLIEPINNIETPGYFLTTLRQAIDAIEAVGSDNLYLQYDVYHRQIMEGNLTQPLISSMPLIKHVQIASVPGRHEPINGEINYPWFLDRLDQLGYQEWVSCEYFPSGNTQQGLDWAACWGVGIHD